MTPVIIFPIAFTLVFVYNAFERSRAKKEAARELEEKERGLVAFSALRNAYADLKRQRAAGYGPWIACCIERAGNGGDLPAEVAVAALRRTRDELAWSRFDISGIEAAIRAIEEETGEGE